MMIENDQKWEVRTYVPRRVMTITIFLLQSEELKRMIDASTVFCLSILFLPGVSAAAAMVKNDINYPAAEEELILGARHPTIRRLVSVFVLAPISKMKSSQLITGRWYLVWRKTKEAAKNGGF